ncbi:MAG: hypothetical protein L0Z53_20455 [Acidobacteriales bacterium]|nr:hypothetical protein [Terriglobales bacterium]
MPKCDTKCQIAASHLRQGSQQILHSRIVTKGLADVREAVHIPRPENEAATELKWVLAYAVLPVAFGFGAGARGRVVAANQVEQVCALQLRGTVRLALLVNEKWEIDPGFLAELTREVGVAQTDSSQ